MANYNVDIAVAIKNAEKLNKFNKQIKDVASNIKGANTFLEAFSKTAKLASGAFDGANGLVRNVDNLQKNLGLTSKNLKSAALGTKEATIAAYQFVKAQEQLNKGLREELALIKEVEKGRRFTRFAKAGIKETTQYSGPIGPGQASSVLGGQSAPVAGKIERTLALRRDEIKLQEALLSLELKSAAVQNEKLQIRGELNRQTATAVNNARFAGQSSPLTSPVFPGYSGPVGPGQASGLFSGGAFRERLMSNLSSSQASRQASAFNIRPGTQYERPIGPAFSANLKAQLRHQKKIDKNTGKTAQLLSASGNRAIFGDSAAYTSPIGPQAARPSFLNRMGFGKNANPQGPFASGRGKAGRISGAASSGLIGGGFPLLFGQGALGAAGGGIGGVAGGLLGGGFGFGLSIAGTAIAQRIAEGRDFEKQIDKVNKSILATGSSATFTSQDIKKLGKTLGMTKQEALEAAQSFKAFDAAMRTSLLVTFGDEATFNLIKGLKTNVNLINDIQEAESIIGREKADQLLTSLRTEGSLKVQKKLQEEIIKVRENERIGNKNKVTNFDRFMGFGRTLGNKYLNLFGQGPGAGNAEVTGEDIKDIRIDKILGENLQDKTTAVAQLGVEFERAMGIKLTSNIAAVRDELEMLMDPINQLTTLAETVGSAFGESFKGLIKGSMSAQEALRNLFMRTADHFLDMAAQMIAKQIQMKILGIGLNFFGGGGFAPSRGANTGGTDRFGRDFDDPMFGTPLANGGIAKAGRTHLVGERGPELFTPGVSGMITPNHALGGGTNVVVNVDASGSSVEGDEDRGRELGRLISVAVQSELLQQKRPGGLLA